MSDDGAGRLREFSYAKLAICSIGAATIVLVATTIVIALLAPSPDIGLGIALFGVVLAVAALGIVATRITNRAFGGPADSDAPDKK